MTLSHPQFDWLVLPVPIEMLVIARTYSDAEYITPLLQFLGSGNTGKIPFSTMLSSLLASHFNR